ncbi:hypothetical protein F4802DRAFT_135241 [Xylaria palmicola]|nr:hypothetical protein F4802DRAFT_135241 [Xylaria palmicola]
MYARPFFVHPDAHTRVNDGIRIERRRQSSGIAAASTADSLGVPARRPELAPAIRRTMAETKVALAASQLSGQIKESKDFWLKFLDEYKEEVNTIKLYAGADILRQIWRKRVEFTSKPKHRNEDDQQFAIRRIMLESSLEQLDEATKLLIETWSSSYSNAYDNRQHHLDKMRAAGNLVVGLSKRAVENEAACVDFLEELAELEKLVNPKNPAARNFHQFDKNKSKNTTRSTEGTMKGTRANKSENRDTTEDTKHEEHDSNHWPVNDEQDNPNTWPEDGEGHPA